jgi:hypothetical protein
MNRIKQWCVPGLFLILSGCVSYSSIELDVLKPAAIEIPVEIASVVVVDNAYPFKVSDSAVHEINLPDRKFAVDTLWVEDFGSRVVQSFGNALKARRFFDSVYVVKDPFNPKGKGKPMDPLTAFELDTLCRHFNAQAVISLDHYDYGTAINVLEMPESFFATLDARSNTYWKLHNCLSGDLYDIHLQKDTIFWEGVGPSINNSAADLPTIREALDVAAHNAGEKYAGYLAPTWTKEERLFYKQGHPLFFRASELISRGEWELASRLWYNVYEEGNQKQKARAAFNLALGQEVRGNFMEAAAWAYRAMEQYRELGVLSVSELEKKETSAYYVELAQRLQEKKKLDEQYGVEQ